MSILESVHAAHGATFDERGGQTVVANYGRPERAHRAVRNGVGLLEAAVGVVVVDGADRLEYVDNVVSNRVPSADGQGCHALVLDPQGRIEIELTIYNAGERLLLVTPPGLAGELVDEWREKVFIQDVEIRDASDEFAVFRVCGPQATEKVASVLHGSATPDERFGFIRGEIGDEGVTVIRADALVGEESYEVVCATEAAEAVHDALSTKGMSAAPFGYDTWESLSLEAGTPLFETELAGEIPNVLGLRGALDFEKGCYVGQEVVSRVENRGQPSRRLVGLVLADDAPVPDSGAAIFDGDASIGAVTRAGESPLRESIIALGLVSYDSDAERVTVRIDGDEYDATREPLPFVDSSERSGRLPSY